LFFRKELYAGKAEVEVAYEYIVVMVAGCNQNGLLYWRAS